MVPPNSEENLVPNEVHSFPITYQTFRELWKDPEIERPSMVVNLIGDYPGIPPESLRHNLISLMDTLNQVHGWLVICGLETIKLIGGLLKNEARHNVDELDHALVCIAIASVEVLNDEETLKSLLVCLRLLKKFN